MKLTNYQLSKLKYYFPDSSFKEYNTSQVKSKHISKIYKTFLTKKGTSEIFLLDEKTKESYNESFYKVVKDKPKDINYKTEYFTKNKEFIIDTKNLIYYHWLSQYLNMEVLAVNLLGAIYIVITKHEYFTNSNEIFNSGFVIYKGFLKYLNKEEFYHEKTIKKEIIDLSQKEHDNIK